MPSRPPLATWLALLCLATLTLSGCGRRGALEAPSAGAAAPSARTATVATRPGAVVVDATDDQEEPATTTFVSPQPNPPKRGRSYTVPQDPFILDALL